MAMQGVYVVLLSQPALVEKIFQLLAKCLSGHYQVLRCRRLFVFTSFAQIAEKTLLILNSEVLLKFISAMKTVKLAVCDIAHLILLQKLFPVLLLALFKPNQVTILSFRFSPDDKFVFCFHGFHVPFRFLRFK